MAHTSRPGAGMSTTATAATNAEPAADDTCQIQDSQHIIEGAMPCSTATGAGRRHGHRCQRMGAPETRSRSRKGDAAGTGNNVKKPVVDKRGHDEIETNYHANCLEAPSKKLKGEASSREKTTNNNNGAAAVAAPFSLQSLPPPQPMLPPAPMVKSGGERKIGSGVASVSPPAGMNMRVEEQQAKPKSSEGKGKARQYDPFSWLDDELPVEPGLDSGRTSFGDAIDEARPNQQPATAQVPPSSHPPHEAAHLRQDSAANNGNGNMHDCSGRSHMTTGVPHDEAQSPRPSYQQTTATPSRPARTAATAEEAAVAAASRIHAGRGEGGEMPTQWTLGDEGAGAAASPAPLPDGAGAWSSSFYEPEGVEKAVKLEDDAKVEFCAARQALRETIQSSPEQRYYVAHARLAELSNKRRVLHDVLQGPAREMVKSSHDKREECSRKWHRNEAGMRKAVDDAMEAQGGIGRAEHALREAQARYVAATAARSIFNVYSMNAFLLARQDFAAAQMRAQTARAAVEHTSGLVDVEMSERFHSSADLEDACLRHRQARETYKKLQVRAEALRGEERSAGDAALEAKRRCESTTTPLHIPKARYQRACWVLDEAVQRVINVKQAESTLNQRLMEMFPSKPGADEDEDVADRAVGSGTTTDEPAAGGASGGDGTSTSEMTAGGRVRVKRKAAVAAAAVWKESGLTGQETKKRRKR